MIEWFRLCARVRIHVLATVLMLAFAASFYIPPSLIAAQSPPPPPPPAGGGWITSNIAASPPGGSPPLSACQDLPDASICSGVLLTAVGPAVSDTADPFSFALRPLTGDVSVVVHVASVQSSDGAAQAGVMIRESLTAGSPHAFLTVSPADGVAFQKRLLTGAPTATSSGGAASRLCGSSWNATPQT